MDNAKAATAPGASPIVGKKRNVSAGRCDMSPEIPPISGMRRTKTAIRMEPAIASTNCITSVTATPHSPARSANTRDQNDKQADNDQGCAHCDSTCGKRSLSEDGQFRPQHIDCRFHGQRDPANDNDVQQQPKVECLDPAKAMRQDGRHSEPPRIPHPSESRICATDGQKRIPSTSLPVQNSTRSSFRQSHLRQPAP